MDIRNISVRHGEEDITLSKRKRKSRLARKLVMSVIAVFLSSAALFLVLQKAAHQIIHNYCAKPEVISMHLAKKTNSLQRYIKTNHISLTELSSLDPWMEKEDLTEVTIYLDDSLIYGSHTAYPDVLQKSSAQETQLPWQNGYLLTFSDGEAVAFINDLFEHRYIDYATYLNLIIFFLCFVTIMVLFIRKKVSYINTLEQEIRVLEGGDLNYAITVKGNDELASLAQEIDEMRRAFISREQYADRMRAASSELMTGISHDLRTPLTALIGYLEVLEGEDAPAGQKSFLQKCKSRAFQIKSLIDNLFEYFFVSACGDEQLQLSSCTVKEALEDIAYVAVI